jgi:hypothetical protein
MEAQATMDALSTAFRNCNLDQFVGTLARCHPESLLTQQKFGDQSTVFHICTQKGVAGAPFLSEALSVNLKGVHCTNVRQETPLHIAARGIVSSAPQAPQHPFVARSTHLIQEGLACSVVLLNAGALLSAVDAKGMSPMHIAAEAGNTLFFAFAQQYLARATNDREENGSEFLNLMSQRDKQGRTPIFYAVFGQHPILLKYLVSLNIPIDGPDIYGTTVIHYAVNRGDLRLLQIAALGVQSEHAHRSHPCSAIGDGTRDRLAHVLHQRDAKGNTPLDAALQTTQATRYTPSWVAAKLVAVQLQSYEHLIAIHDCERETIEQLRRVTGHDSVFSFLGRLALAVRVAVQLPRWNTRLALCTRFLSRTVDFPRNVFPVLSTVLAWWFYFDLIPAMSNKQLGSLHTLLAMQILMLICLVAGWLGYLHCRLGDPGYLTPVTTAPTDAGKPTVDSDANSMPPEINLSRRNSQTQHGYQYERCQRAYKQGLERGVDAMSLQNGYCVTCQIAKPPRCKHCDRCGKCVNGFDHCCPWTGRCIGELNHGSFVVFVLGATGTCAVYLAAFFTFCANVSICSTTPTELGVRTAFLCKPIFTLISLQPLWLGAFGFLLLLQHLRVILTALTTNEILNKSKYAYLTGRKPGQTAAANPFDKGSYAANCAAFWKQGYASWAALIRQFLRASHLGAVKQGSPLSAASHALSDATGTSSSSDTAEDDQGTTKEGSELLRKRGSTPSHAVATSIHQAGGSLDSTNASGAPVHTKLRQSAAQYIWIRLRSALSYPVASLREVTQVLALNIPQQQAKPDHRMLDKQEKSNRDCAVAQQQTAFPNSNEPTSDDAMV